MENLLSTRIPIAIPSNGPIPPFPRLQGSRFDPKTAETVAFADIFLKKNISYDTYGDIVERRHLTCVEEYGGGFFKPNTFKRKKALIAYPKSGSEFTRSLVLAAFGMLIHHKTIIRSPTGRLSEPNKLDYTSCDCFMLQRDHDIGLKGFNESRLKFYHREAILLIRSPFECIFHHYIFLSKSRIKEGYILKNLFIENKGWGNFVVERIRLWEKLYTHWIKGMKRGGIVYYERLEADTETELLRFGGLMGFTWIDKNRLDCTLNRGRPINFRSGAYSTSIDPYSPAQKLQISEAIDRIQLLLMEYGFDPLPTEMYKFYEPTDLLFETDKSDRKY